MTAVLQLASWRCWVLAFCVYSLLYGAWLATAAPVREQDVLAWSGRKLAKVLQVRRPTSRVAGAGDAQVDYQLHSQQSCQSSLGVQVNWSWWNQSQGLIFWEFHNPTNESHAVVLNRGASDVQAYPFGGAFFAAYLTGQTDGVQLASIGTGPYPPLTMSATYPLGLIDAQQTGLAFIFVIPAQMNVFIPEGGFVDGILPFCESLVDVDFVSNQGMQMSYSVCENCLEFYAQTQEQPPYYCPETPMQTDVPVYRPTNESAVFDFWPQKGSKITLGPATFSEPVQFPKTDSASNCPLSASNARGSTGCFTASAVVEREDGQLTTLATLELGARVATLVRDRRRGWRKRFTTVYAFLDKQPHTDSISYLKLRTASGEVLQLTPDHLVYTALKDDGHAAQYRRARHVSPGMALIRADGSLDPITHVLTAKEQTAYAPLTTEGSLLVNGYLASCYADVDSHGHAHAFFAPLRAWKRLFGISERPEVVGLHWYAQFLISLRKFIQSNRTVFP
jgi:hypothetical protein